uniref:glycoside hydrolase family 3 protein n=1 Tax=Altererythrobacter segetis TaxID=1104773 RepID=UPI001408300E|nr:glycoside hydrolase family 3 C-terminal domain-containing protein [Altererythrobacter segetis]
MLLAAFAHVAAAQTSGSAELWATQDAQCKAAEGEARPWTNKGYAPECRARYALAEFKTLDEKLRFLSPPPPNQPTDGRDVAKLLGIPAIAGSDGPAGLVRGAATALPSPIAVAASFDPAMATKYGTVLGEEFRAAGLGTILGPAFDTARTWRFGRLSESMGEDPFLAAAMAGPEVRAISDHGVNVTMKHYAAYTQEAGRVGDQPSGSAQTVDNVISEKALREIYLPPFEVAVKRGGAGAAMCSFPRVNGTYACENAHLFDILKREWGFDGSVGPDFPSAQRSITRAVIAGLDSGSFGPSPFNAALASEKPLAQAVRDGDVPEARIDDMILRRLIPLFRLGQYDDPPGKGLPDVSTAEHRATAAEIVAAGTVLLKNDGGILPLGKLVRSVALIGPQATDRATVVEQGSPYVKPVHLAPVLPAVEARAGSRISVTHADGTLGLGALPPFDAAQVSSGDEPGWRAEYFANPNLDFSAAPIARAVVADPSLDKAPAVDGLPAHNQWSVRYTTTFAPAESGVHRFTLHGSGSARLLVDGKPAGGFEVADFGNAVYANLELEAGKRVALEIDYTPRSALRDQRMEMFGMEMGLTLRVGHAPPDDLIAQAVEVARQADVAVVFAGERVGEGMDRSSLSLQADQDRLIEAVAAANPNTVVVLSTGGPVAMPWLGQVAAVMETWMPGDAFGPAVAAMLFGDAEPGGRLPVTFPADETQGPGTQRHQFPGLADPATGRLAEAYYDEGVNVGYQFWDAHDQRPLFEFGHGLGYGDVALEGVRVADSPDGGKVVAVRVRNQGLRPGSAVPQVYLGFPEAAREPPRQLKGFARLALAPGEEQLVEIPLPPEAFRYWDPGKPGWVSGGTYEVMVGASSRDIVWHETIEVPAH